MMVDFLTLPPEIERELAGFVRHSMTRARMHICRLARDASSLTDEQAHVLDDGHQLGAILRAVVDDTILSTLNRLNGRNAYPLPEDLPAEILCDIWSHLDFRDRFAVTGVCRSWRNIGIATPLHWQRIEFVTTSHDKFCNCKDCFQAERKPGSGGNNLDRIQLALTRGGRCDLHLVTKMILGDTDRRYVGDDPVLVDFLAEIHVHVDRIRSLTYVTDSFEYLHYALSGNLPHLQVFILQIIGNDSRLFHRRTLANGLTGPWQFNLDVPRLEQFHSPIGGVLWHTRPGNSQVQNITRISIEISDGVGGIKIVFDVCPRLEHARFIVRQLNLSYVYPSEALNQVRPLKTIAIDGIHSLLETNALQHELEFLWQSLLSLRAQDFVLEYAFDEDPYVAPSHGLGLFAPNTASGGFAVKVVCLTGDVVVVSRKDITAVTTDVIHFDNIPGPIRTIRFHGDALPDVFGPASELWLGDIWTLHLQLGESNFDDTISRIIRTLSRMITVSVLLLAVPTEERGQQFIANARMSPANLPNMRVVHIVTPKATTTKLLSATT